MHRQDTAVTMGEYVEARGPGQVRLSAVDECLSEASCLVGNQRRVRDSESDIPAGRAPKQARTHQGNAMPAEFALLPQMTQSCGSFGERVELHGFERDIAQAEWTAQSLSRTSQTEWMALAGDGPDDVLGLSSYDIHQECFLTTPTNTGIQTGQIDRDEVTESGHSRGYTKWPLTHFDSSATDQRDAQETHGAGNSLLTQPGHAEQSPCSTYTHKEQMLFHVLTEEYRQHCRRQSDINAVKNHLKKVLTRAMRMVKSDRVHVTHEIAFCCAFDASAQIQPSFVWLSQQ